MKPKIIWLFKNDVVFWIFFMMLCAVMTLYIIKKEDIKITINFGETYGNKVITIGK